MTPDESVFSRLPDSRPGVRSPRRRSTTIEAAETAPHKTDAIPEPPETDAIPEPPVTEPNDPAPQPHAAETGPGPTRRAPRGIEDAAWAGVAVAAEAATLGVRLANRALEALRDAGERR